MWFFERSVSVVFVLGISGCASTAQPQETRDADAALSVAAISPAHATVTAIEDVTWEDLNPARGDQSPRAGTLWGDRNGTEATGYLLKPVDGFRSPPHIHNVTYRAIVIRGVLHNDDALAEDMWMPAGSFWTQPKGAPHITAAKGADTLAYIEIDEGPYLVHAAEDAFASNEQPINVHARNLVWVPVDGQSLGKAEVCYLWGEPQKAKPHGVFVKMPPHAKIALTHDGATLHVVVVSGRPTLTLAGAAETATLSPGTHFSSIDASTHPLACTVDDECVLYVRATGTLDVTDQ